MKNIHISLVKFLQIANLNLVFDQVRGKWKICKFKLICDFQFNGGIVSRNVDVLAQFLDE